MAKAILNGNEIFGNVHIGEGGDVANPNIADVYDPTQTYNTGDRRIYDDVLYVCNDDNVTGAWDSTKWDSATIDEIISALTAADIPYSAGVSVADKLGAVDTALNKFGFNKIKTQTFTGLTIPANYIDTQDFTLTVPADYGILCGFSLAGTSNCAVIQCYFTNTTTLHTRVLNLANNQDTYSFVVFYI